MSLALEPYGPEGGGIFTSGFAGLGQRLMCFTPEDRFEQQPATDPAGAYVLVSDCRIDNRAELSEELGIAVHQASRLPDSAFILRAYEKWGQDCPGRLIGAFAFALYDRKEQLILLSRCRMGERSLFYYQTPALIAFASAPCGLFALPFIPREIDPRTVADFLVRAPRDSGTSFFNRINSLPAGHSMVIRQKKLQTRFYGGLDARETRFRNDEDYVEAFNVLFDRVVADQLRSQGPAGISLSGGLDSTAVAAAAARSAAAPCLHTFTEVPAAGFDSPVPRGRRADETPLIQAMARRYPGLNVHFVQSGESFYLADLDQFFTTAETPLRNASNWPWIKAIAENASQNNARVLLTGTPGNITASWAGERLLPDLIRQYRWRRAVNEARGLAGASSSRSAARILVAQGIAPLLPARLWRAVQRLRNGGPLFASETPWEDSPIRPEFAKLHQVMERARAKGHNFDAHGATVDRRAWVVQRGDLRGDFQRGLEARFRVQLRNPMADLRLVEFCVSIPEDQYLRKGEDRWLIRRAVASRLPEEVLNNKLRGLQAAGWLESMRAARAELSEQIEALRRSPAASAAIDLERLRGLASRIMEVRSDAPQTIHEYRGILERGIIVGRFLAWMESNRIGDA